MKTVNDMYKEVLKNDEMLLSGYMADFWDDYRLNHKKYDKLFRRMFKSFRYFLQEDDESISEITDNFIEDVYNHLLIHDKRYSEIYRIHVIDDTEYSLIDNYNITETMDRDTTSIDTNTYGERTDTNTMIEGSRTDENNNTYGNQSNDTTSKVAPMDSENFYNNTNSIENIGSKTDSLTFTKGVETDSNTIVKGSETDGFDNTSTEDYVLTRKGNIGVQTVTDMLDKHKKFWTRWEFYYFIFMEISKELLMI